MAPSEQCSGPLQWFVEHVELLRGVIPDERELAQAVAVRLGPLLANRSWLGPAERQPGEDSYRQHLLYVAPDGGLSVVALVWKPGQQTPIHDHVSWCVVGVYEGAEVETRYHLYQDKAQPFLLKVGQETARAGQTMALVPPDEDIHHVACASSETAISIHVYGADIGQLGSSINRRFDHLPIRSSAGSAQRISWRAAGGDLPDGWVDAA
jgi:predicted metal-dependent enzyme (double-stranded beta helix superfamily)